MEIKIWPTSFYALRDYNNVFCFEIREKDNAINMRVDNPKKLIEILTKAYNDHNDN